MVRFGTVLSPKPAELKAHYCSRYYSIIETFISVLYCRKHHRSGLLMLQLIYGGFYRTVTSTIRAITFTAYIVITSTVYCSQRYLQLTWLSLFGPGRPCSARLGGAVSPQAGIVCSYKGVGAGGVDMRHRGAVPPAHGHCHNATENGRK